MNETELIFTNESQQNKVGKLPIKLNEDEWKEACFCVNLCSIGDAATILWIEMIFCNYNFVK